jgi:hypothetical protein
MGQTFETKFNAVLKKKQKFMLGIKQKKVHWQFVVD